MTTSSSRSSPLAAGPAVEGYAFLSDCHAPALVSPSGSVDWWCPPRADEPSVFGRLLDPAAGHWSLGPDQPAEVTRRYVTDSLVLESIVTTASGRVVVRDCLALEPGARGHDIGHRSPQVLARTIEGVDGAVSMRCEFAPRFEYGRTVPHLVRDEGGILAHAGPTRCRLVCPVGLEERDSTVSGVFTVTAGERLSFTVAYVPSYGGAKFSTLEAFDALADTTAAWVSWADAHPGYDGPHADLARRSALVLQGLTYQPSGAVLAAATTSLPAAIGGSSNWDYRYAWLRDLSLTTQALWIAACPDEVARFLRFIAHAAGTPAPASRVQIMYGVDGRRDLTEHQLDHLRGFAASRPVRVGNAAWDQSQLDVMGEVLDMAYRFADQIPSLDEQATRLLVWLANEAADTWESPDAGMWEARDRQRHYLSSKVMCWVALDRAVKLSGSIGGGEHVERWGAVRDEIRDAVLHRGWNEDVGAFTGAFGSDQLDASVLVLPLVGFLAADDERMAATIDAVERELVQNGLVYRWDGDTNGFVLCSFWLVECLLLAGKRDRAADLFAGLTSRASDLGLFAEQIDPDTGHHTGNFPQAFSHVGLINAAWRLDTGSTDRGT